MSYYTTDIISSCIFGIDSNTLKNKSEFYEIGQKLIKHMKKYHLWHLIGMIFTNQIKSFGIKNFNQEFHNYFEQLIHKVIGFRKRK